MTPDVIGVKILPEYHLEVIFETNEINIFDMRPYLDFPAFLPLKNNNLFRCAHVKNGTVVWNDDIDMSPDTLYISPSPLRGT